jgi:hemoglobin-like flavoprotein
MDEQHIDLLQTSQKCILPIAETIADTFYQQLHKREPTICAVLQHLHQHRNDGAGDILDLLFRHGDHLEVVAPDIRQLEQHYTQHGLQTRHYATIGVVLLWALRHNLRTCFPPDVEAAWARAYARLVDMLQDEPDTD